MRFFFRIIGTGGTANRRATSPHTRPRRRRRQTRQQQQQRRRRTAPRRRPTLVEQQRQRQRRRLRAQTDVHRRIENVNVSNLLIKM